LSKFQFSSIEPGFEVLSLYDSRCHFAAYVVSLPGFFELAILADVYVHLDDRSSPRKLRPTSKIQLKHQSGSIWDDHTLAGNHLGAKDLVLSRLQIVDWRAAQTRLILQALQDSAIS